MKAYQYSNLSKEEILKLCDRPRIDFNSIFSTVEPILEDVRQKGDEAIRYYNSKFDGVKLDSIAEIPDVTAGQKIDPTVKEAFEIAYQNISNFHLAQLPKDLYVETMSGISCRRTARPIERVGLYVPGGSAILPSTALMLAIPAKIAGCREIVLATPPKKDGSIPMEIHFIAHLTGVTKILKAGGAQAIAAMAYGTESVPKVDKILGPGNQYVTAAKMLLQNSEAGISIDMPAGPSEVLVIADHQANPVFVAADLLSQAEHGPDSQVVLVSLDGFDTGKVQKEIDRQAANLPRKAIAEKALAHSYIVEVSNMEEAITFSNTYAPEHLIINVENAGSYVDYILNAGSVFLGPWSPESVGDYASGTNHTLPTYGFARNYSGVSLNSYIKFITVQELNEEGLRAIGKTVMTMAEVEQLDAHKNAVDYRLKNINETK